MTNFAEELSKLISEWLDKGDTVEAVVEAMLREIESLEDEAK